MIAMALLLTISIMSVIAWAALAVRQDKATAWACLAFGLIMALLMAMAIGV